MMTFAIVDNGLLPYIYVEYIILTMVYSNIITLACISVSN